MPRCLRCRTARAVVLGVGAMLVSVAQAASSVVEPRQNWFDDPFFQVASGLPRCRVPEGPLYTEQERRAQMHNRLERGTSCWLAGRCAEPNAYRYDAALAPKVRAALAAVPGVRRASVWVTIQRRWVYLQGCVPSRTLAGRLERAVRTVADVETVVPDLMTGTRGKPPYAVAHPGKNQRDE